MKILKIIGIIVVLLALAISVMVFTLPDTVHLERSILIEASPETIYRDLVSYRSFDKWSPWSEKDPNLVVQLSGSEFGVGHKYSWSGNEDVGKGSMEIIEAVPNEKVVSVMDFGFNSLPQATFLLEKQEEKTKVTWTYDESNVSGMAKLFMLGLDSFLGSDYEKGLENLKNRTESAPVFNSDIGVSLEESYYYYGVSASTKNDLGAISETMTNAYGQILDFMSKNGIEQNGVPIAEYTFYSDSSLNFVCGIPAAEKMETQGGVELKNSYEGLTVKNIFKGDYAGFEKAYEDLEQYISFYGLTMNGNPWEQYITDPVVESDTSQWITHIFYPVQ